MTVAEFFRTHDWCQSAMERDARGFEVINDHEAAVSFCLVRAIRIVYPSHAAQIDAERAIRAQLRIIDPLYANDYLSNWNDTFRRTKAEVIELCERAGV